MRNIVKKNNRVEPPGYITKITVFGECFVDSHSGVRQETPSGRAALSRDRKSASPKKQTDTP